MYRSPISKATLYLILIGKEANYTQIQERFLYIILVKYNLLPFYTPTTMQLRRNPNSKYSKRYHCAKLNVTPARDNSPQWNWTKEGPRFKLFGDTGEKGAAN